MFFLKKLLILTVVFINIRPAFAEIQRDFPTGSQLTSVVYLDTENPQNPTACMVTISVGLPYLSIGFSFMSDNHFTFIVSSKKYIPDNISIGSSATIKINSIYLFSKVKRTSKSGLFHSILLDPVDDINILQAYGAVNEIVTKSVGISVVADSAALPSVNILAQPEIGDVLIACQKYMAMKFKSR